MMIGTTRVSSSSGPEEEATEETEVDTEETLLEMISGESKSTALACQMKFGKATNKKQ